MDINGELPCQAIGHEIDEEFLTSSHKNIGGIKILLQNSPHVADDYMMGLSEIATSDKYLPFKIHECYHLCDQCQAKGMPTLARKLYPSIATLPSKYKTIPDVEAYIFPITRKSDGKAVHEGYFQEVMEFVADLSSH
ncbi:hypothetical protein DAPPUDRAFT_323733 [Daphnia pulex]|uniref:Uncharacterized protein n=1 Tax=Daphnia pulex TaxID=6669 RepID=E9GZL9_DAPPU|nr:hypothetical protein DAPPUDRAFT_323733 [Daphnia pulex]|eukprot:EFX75084.1 hypothetical protein DAPPUDRAFT_323733 [Daphnia pulex]